ncbi:MAG: C4-dicarboxylate ABC transporter permease [Aurantimonas sp.]|uniref:TRAP transporter small permease n=1 Tax=Aurantimonas coralicida TaxID=182270 RepID=UPI000C418A87|nr:TRAP transporter small permease [Aurantimonas coralicida]MAP18679.1 C4-dicarboxylate ABC transporter permease [Aurantimonas sp.]MAY30509.1 C4-dicarboxylate ABC transporter permease [Aurantimonas sp.]MCD1644831.1 TRAP transporter small permease [Aurantimonas coralicida]
MRAVLEDAEKIVCAVIFLVMTGIGFLNVVVRYLTSYSFAATQEILLNGFLLLTIFGAAIAARRGEHLAVTLFADLLPPAGRRVGLWLSTGLSVFLLCLSAWYCYGLVAHQYASGVTSPGLQVPAWYYTLGLPLGFLLIALRLVQHTLGFDRALRAGDERHA